MEEQAAGKGGESVSGPGGQLNQELAESKVTSQLMSFFFPILAGSFFQQFYNMIDAVIVGHYVGKQALGAVGGSTTMIISLILNLFLGLSSAASVIVAQAYGAKDAGRVEKGVRTSVAIAVVIGGALGVIGFLSAPAILEIIATPKDIFPLAVTYIRIYVTGFVFSCIYNMGAGILRATGDNRRPLYYLVASAILNMILDVVFVAVMGWGVAGAAVATVAAQLISALLILSVLCSAGGMFQLRLSGMSIDQSVAGHVLRLGVPIGLQSNMYAFANLIIQGQVNTYGTDTVAAWAAMEKIDGFYWIMIAAFGIAMTTFTGQNFGAGQYGRIKKGAKICLGLSAVSAVLISAVMLLFAEQFMGIFTSDQTVLRLGVQYLYFLVPFYITYIFTEILSSVIRGCGESLVPMVITCVGVCVIRMIWTGGVHLLHGNMFHLIAGFPLTWIATSIVFIVYYTRSHWLDRCLGIHICRKM